MPVATIINAQDEFLLKTVEGGRVVIRRMSWGEKLKRQGMITGFKMDMGGKRDDMKAEIDIFQEAVSHWEFANLIVEHNLTDANDRPLNFKNISDQDSLDPRVGEEIQRYIDDLNAFEDKDEVKN